VNFGNNFEALNHAKIGFGILIMGIGAFFGYPFAHLPDKFADGVIAGWDIMNVHKVLLCI